MPEDEDATKEFCREKRRAAVPWLSSRGLTEADAHDLVSDVFKVMLEGSPEDPDAFFWVTLRKMLARRRQRDKDRDMPDEWIAHGLYRQDPLPDEEVFKKECVELLEAILGEVTEAQAEVARLLVDGWEVPEIAAELEVSESTVRTHIERLRQRLWPMWPDDLRPG